MRTITNKPAVETTKLSFSHAGNPVIQDMDLKINQGEYVALLGSNGSGKSTLFELILGTLKPKAGTISLAHSAIAFVPQRSEFNELLPMTVKDAVRMGRWAVRGHLKPLTRVDNQIVSEQMERLQISDIQDKQLTKLSGGQKQRALIAQALAQQAPLIMLDEPESGLDSTAAEIINSVLKEEQESGRTIIIATHDRGSALNADRCVLLSKKQHGIIADGTPEEVLQDRVLARSF